MELNAKELTKAIVVGIIIALILAGMQVTALKIGVSPLPKPVSLAFADKLLGMKLPLPVGLLFHVIYVTFWTVVYVWVFRKHFTFWNALWQALFMWLILAFVFFPFIGWGLFGLGINPKITVASLIIHILFALFAWIGVLSAFKRTEPIPRKPARPTL